MTIIKQHQQIGTVRRYHDAEFLICNSCFWCASILSNNAYFEVSYLYRCKLRIYTTIRKRSIYN